MPAEVSGSLNRQYAKDAAINSARHETDCAAPAWLALAELAVATVVGAINRQLLVLMAEPLKLSFSFSDTHLGPRQDFGVALLAGLAALSIGWLADHFDRRVRRSDLDSGAYQVDDCPMSHLYSIAGFLLSCCNLTGLLCHRITGG